MIENITLSCWLLFFRKLISSRNFTSSSCRLSCSLFSIISHFAICRSSSLLNFSLSSVIWGICVQWDTRLSFHITVCGISFKAIPILEQFPKRNAALWWLDIWKTSIHYPTHIVPLWCSRDLLEPLWQRQGIHSGQFTHTHMYRGNLESPKDLNACFGIGLYSENPYEREPANSLVVSRQC